MAREEVEFSGHRPLQGAGMRRSASDGRTICHGDELAKSPIDMP